MKINDLLLELYADELSDMFAGNRNDPDESRAKVLPLLNTAMSLAYAKWKCKYNSYMLAITSDVNEYEIPEVEALVSYPLLQITSIVNVYGQDVPSSQWQALGRKIYFPYPETQTLEVIFKVPHTKYTTAQDDELVDLELPEMLVPWLKAYVAHRFFASMKTEEALAKSADFLAQAMMAENVFVSTNTTNEFTAVNNEKLSARGFA